MAQMEERINKSKHLDDVKKTLTDHVPGNSDAGVAMPHLRQRRR